MICPSSACACSRSRRSTGSSTGAGTCRRDGRRLQLERELRRNARETRAAVRELIADLQLLSGRKVAYQ